VRNFLRNAGLQRTAEAFETEWYEARRGQVSLARALPHPPTQLTTPHVCAQLQAQGQLTLEGTGAVPDAYARVQELEDIIKVRSPRPLALAHTSHFGFLTTSHPFSCPGPAGGAGRRAQGGCCCDRRLGPPAQGP
jgi:hypothetical protein